MISTILVIFEATNLYHISFKTIQMVKIHPLKDNDSESTPHSLYVPQKHDPRTFSIEQTGSTSEYPVYLLNF